MLVQKDTIECVAGHTGAAVGITESQHVTVGSPGAFTIPAGSVVFLHVDTGNAGTVLPIRVRFAVCNIVVIERCGGGKVGVLRIIDQTEDVFLRAVQINDVLFCCTGFIL